MPPHIFLKIVEADALALCARPQHPAPFFIYEFFEFYHDDDENNDDEDDTFQKCSGGIQGHPRIKLLAIACANDIRKSKRMACKARRRLHCTSTFIWLVTTCGFAFRRSGPISLTVVMD